MADSYSIKEVIKARFDEMGEHLKEIKEQTTKTNGRVSSLETSRIQVWTAITILTLLGGTIITLAIMAINNKIKEGISEALSIYEVPNK